MGGVLDVRQGRVGVSERERRGERGASRASERAQEICSTSGKETHPSAARREREKKDLTDKGNMDATERYPCTLESERISFKYCT